MKFKKRWSVSACQSCQTKCTTVFYWMQFRGWREIRWNKGNWSQDRLALTRFFEWTHRSLSEKINNQVPQFSFHIWGQSGFNGLKNLNMYNWTWEKYSSILTFLKNNFCRTQISVFGSAMPHRHVWATSDPSVHSWTWIFCQTVTFSPLSSVKVFIWKRWKMEVLSLSFWSLWLQNHKKHELMVIASRV